MDGALQLSQTLPEQTYRWITRPDGNDDLLLDGSAEAKAITIALRLVRRGIPNVKDINVAACLVDICTRIQMDEVAMRKYNRAMQDEGSPTDAAYRVLDPTFDPASVT